MNICEPTKLWNEIVESGLPEPKSCVSTYGAKFDPPLNDDQNKIYLEILQAHDKIIRSISVDKNLIMADGEDKSIVTIQDEQSKQITIKINDVEEIIETDEFGFFKLAIASNVQGTIIVLNLQGNQVKIKAV